MGEKDVVLSERENLEVLHQVILPTATRGAARQDRPVVVIVCGQPGAGKTWIADLVQAVLDHRGGAVRIGRDLYKPAHRHYAALLAADVRTAGAAVRPDTSRWQSTIEEHVRARRFACPGVDAVARHVTEDQHRDSETYSWGTGKAMRDSPWSRVHRSATV
nr:zeta toxin family protein [Streptomyces sp. NBC_00857]